MWFVSNDTLYSKLPVILLDVEMNIFSKFLEHEHFFIAILISEQFYNAKKKKEFILIFEAIFRFLSVKVFLSIKAHMHEYIPV
jgi:hypothetical protein